MGQSGRRGYSRLIAGAVAGLALSSAGMGRGAEMVTVRTDVASTSGTPIRVVEIMDVTNAERSTVRGVQLWFAGPEFRFIVLWRVETSSNSSFSIVGPKDGQVVTYRRRADLSMLTPQEYSRGSGVLEVGNREFVVHRDDSSAPTVRARVEKALLEVFSPEEVSAIRSAIHTVEGCNLRLARTSILKIVAPDAYRRDGRPCEAKFRDVAPEDRDRAWELRFVAREPIVQEFLEWNPGLAKGVPD